MTGVGRYAVELLGGLAEKARSGELRIRAAVLGSSVEDLRRVAELEGVEWVPVPWDYESHPSGDWALRFRIPKLVQEDEVYHAPAFILPGGKQPFRRVVTIHDLGVFKRPADYPWKFGAYLRWRIRSAVKFADRLIVPTNAVAEDLSGFLPQARDRVRVVHEAPTRIRIPAWEKETDLSQFQRSLPCKHFFLSIGTIERRKDPWSAARAMEKLIRGSAGEAPEWVWIGGSGFQGQELIDKIKRSSVSGRFHFIGFQGEGNLDEALKRAAALVYPSLDEGFGLPPLKAMALGIPAIVSDLPVLREVCGDAALYFPQSDSESLAIVLRRVLTEPALVEELKDKGFKRVATFSWKKAALETVKVYSECGSA